MAGPTASSTFKAKINKVEEFNLPVTVGPAKDECQRFFIGPSEQ